MKTRSARAVAPSGKVAAGLWIRLAKCYGSVLREVRNGQVDTELTLPQFDVLAQLLRHPGGMSAGELSEALLVTAGNVTGLVSRLERRGLVRREASEADGRVRVLRLTPRGKKIARAAVARHERWLAEIFGELAPREQERMSHSLDRLYRAMETRKTV